MFDRVELSHGVLDHFNVSSSISFEYSTDIPTEWTDDTILDANFNNNLSADKVKMNLSDVTSVKIKRREFNTFDWLTLFEINIENVDDLNFFITDCYNKSGIKYEYAIVPTIQGQELGYIMANVDSYFDSTFVCDYGNLYKLFANVSFGTTESCHKIGSYTLLKRQYPIMVSSALTDYKTGSVTGTVLNNSYENTRIVDRYDIVKRVKAIDSFLKNKQKKILKDQNGNMWLVTIVGNPTMTYASNYGNGIVDLNFSWVEQGDAESQIDLYENDLINVIE